MNERLLEIAEEAYQRAFDYADEIYTKKRPSSDLVFRAISRFYNDLERCKDDGEALFWDKEEAIKALAFLSVLPLVDGEHKGKRLELMPFHAFIVINIYGFRVMRHGESYRRFRKAHVSVPRKSAKSTLSGGIALYETVREAGAQVFSAATTKDQAKMCWNSAREMIRLSPVLKKRFGANNQMIYEHNDNSFYKAVASDSSTLDGLNVQMAVIDEYHAHKDGGALYDIMATGTAARRDPLILSITTAGLDLSSHCLQHETGYMIPMLKGSIDNDDDFFVLIYGIDAGDDYFDESTWWKANPALGIAKSIDDMRSIAKEAKAMPYKLAEFKTKHLNIWVNTAVEWLKMDEWAKCPESVSDEELRGVPCYIGVDKARVQDFTSITAIFKLTDGTFDVRSVSLLPEDSIETATAEYKALLKRFVADGWLTLTDGNIVSDDAVLDTIQHMLSKYDVKEVVFDNFGATNVQYKLQEQGIPVIAVSQSTKTMHEPMQETESMILSKKLRNPRNSVLTWSFGNVILKSADAKNMYPAKAHADAKIDPAVALFMALNRAIVNKDVSLDGFLDSPLIF